MKVVSWNCGGWTCGGFDKTKIEKISINNPDIFVIQEITKKEFEIELDRFVSKQWYGDDIEESYKGIAIFSNTFDIKINKSLNPKFRYIIPYDIYKGSEKVVLLLSVWTKKPQDGSDDYQKQLFDSLKYYSYKEPYLIIGDFNTGSNERNYDQYKILVDSLEEYSQSNCAIGTEVEFENTFFHDKTQTYYANDFCFISKELKGKPIRFTKKEEWKRINSSAYRWENLSDHSPIEFEIDFK